MKAIANSYKLCDVKDVENLRSGLIANSTSAEPEMLGYYSDDGGSSGTCSCTDDQAYSCVDQCSYAGEY